MGEENVETIPQRGDSIPELEKIMWSGNCRHVLDSIFMALGVVSVLS